MASALVSLWGIFWMLFFLGASIFIHELGHFLMAKKRGLQVTRFSIGFGPKLFAWKRGETEYRLSLFPIGGYVAIPQLGIMPILEGKGQAPAQSISCLDKCLVAVMGAVFNLLFAISLACILWVFGVRIPESYQTRTVGYILPDYQGQATPAAQAGLQVGDEILSVDGSPVSTFTDIEKKIILGTRSDANGRPQAVVEYRRKGVVQTATLNLKRIKTNEVTGDEVRFSGIIAPQQQLIIDGFAEASPAGKCGLKVGDRIVQVDGIPVMHVAQLHHHLNAKEHTSVTFTYEREGLLFTVDCPVQSNPCKRAWLRYGSDASFVDLYEQDGALQVLERHGSMFAAFPMDSSIKAVDGRPFQQLKPLEEYLARSANKCFMFKVVSKGQSEMVTIPNENLPVQLHPEEAIRRVGIFFTQPTVLVHPSIVRQFKHAFVSTFETLEGLLNRHSDIKVQHLMGAPGIMRVLYRFSIDDFRSLLNFIIVLNINLALINLLPIPVLDGGCILFALVEKMRKRALSKSVALWVQNTFAVLLLSLIGYTIVFDLLRWKGDRMSEAHQDRLQKLMIAPQLHSER